jgi:U3 small nucleolar RNA-associated protein 25
VEEVRPAELPTKRSDSVANGGDDDEDELVGDEETLALAGEEHKEEEEEAEDGGDELDDVDAMQWRSASYDKHYGGEWPSSALDAQAKTWRPNDVDLPGLGSAQALVPAKSAAALAATTASSASGASAEAFMKRCGVLPGMRTAWVTAHGDGPLTEQQAALLALLSSRADVHCAQTPLTAYDELTPILALHAASHIVLTQKMLMRHKKKGLTPADQGFTKPTVLVLLPFRSHALAFVKALLALLPPCYEQVENKGRFCKEYDEEEGSPPMPASKPEDYKQLFDGNNDDCFRCALRLTRKACKLYSGFYAADLIVGSPLGLRTLIGEEGTGGGKRSKKKGSAKEPGASVAGDADWLTSVELCLVPYADVLLMQNWSHVADLFELLNRLPTQQRDTDFSRVRPWYLEGDAKRLRQTAMLSAHSAPELSAIIARGCANVAGRVATRPTYDGILGHAPPGIRQLFVRFDATDPTTEADQRLAAFKDRLLPSLLTAMTAAVGAAQTLLFVPRYFDFVRVRSLLVAEDVPFVSVSEYSTPSQVGKARHALQTKEVPLLLYTERAHFFRRHKLRGARHLAVYSPPSYPHFYTELVQQLDRAAEAAGALPIGGAAAATGTSSGDATCVTLFCKLDAYPLQRLVGTERAARMISSQQESSFLFR